MASEQMQAFLEGLQNPAAAKRPARRYLRSSARSDVDALSDLGRFYKLHIREVGHDESRF